MKNKKWLSLLFIAILVTLGVILSFGSINLRLYIAYAVFFIAIISAIGFFLYNLVANFKKNLSLLLAILGIIGLNVLYYLITPRSDVDPQIFEKTGTSFAWSPIIGAGLYFLYTLLGLFILALIFFSFRNLTK